MIPSDQMAPRIIFENDAFIIVDKAAGWLSIPGRTGDKDPRPCLQVALSQKLKQPVYIVHRLDSEVSGLILFALTPAAHRSANLWFEQRTVQKIYAALTEGPLPEFENNRAIVFEDCILRGKKRAYTSPVGKNARTEAIWEGEGSLFNSPCQRWRLKPTTGRGHQLRFQLASRGHPIIGDQLYGAKVPFAPLDGIALRAVELGFGGCEGAQKLGLPERIVIADFSNNMII